MTVNVILQARMSSTRLPGKVLKPVLGKAMLAQQIERIQQAKTVSKTIVATSVEASDDAIAQLCQSLRVPCFRGDLANVLKRFYDCSEQYPAAHYVRLTGDCPLTDPALLDDVIQHHLHSRADYTTNAYPFTFPDGLDIEVFSQKALFSTYQQASSAEELEHVTVFMRNHPELFHLTTFESATDLSNHRWTVDYPEDFQLVDAIFKHFQHNQFSYQQVLALLAEKPELVEINQAVAPR